MATAVGVQSLKSKDLPVFLSYGKFSFRGCIPGYIVELYPNSTDARYYHIAAIIDQRDLVGTKRSVKAEYVPDEVLFYAPPGIPEWNARLCDGFPENPRFSTSPIARKIISTAIVAVPYVYFIAADEVGLIKIGWSVNPARRLEQLTTLSPVELRLIKWISGTSAYERELHVKFKHLRVRGEWFRATKELVEFIQGL